MSVLFVVPTLGTRPVHLQHALDSVQSQGVLDLDVVLVAPPGRGVERIAESRGTRFAPDPGHGISAALNAGIAAATPGTEYFAWLGDDDLLTEGSLAAALAVLREDPTAVLVYGRCDYIDGQGNVVFRSHAGKLARWILSFGPNLIPQPGVVMRYADVVASGGLDEDVRFAMDLDLFLRLAQRGRFRFLPRTLACFRWHADSQTVANGRDSMEESDRVRMRYMPKPAARVYEFARWPGRWALALAKRRAQSNAVRAGTGTA